MPAWVGVLGYCLFVSVFILFSVFSLRPFAGLLAAYIMGEFYLQFYDRVVGLPDDQITIVEHEIRTLGLEWLYTQNSRTLVISDEELASLQRLQDYPAYVPADEQDLYLDVTCAWPTKVFLSGRKELINVADLRDLHDIAKRSDFVESTPRE
jgi:hypothetical protein